MFAGFKKLDNLCAIVDNNGLQIDGKITEVMSPLPIGEKFKAFGWHVIEIMGHDFDLLETAFNEAKATKGMPTVIIQKSIKGKCVSFMEDNVEWHGTAPNADQYGKATEELNQVLACLEVE